MSNDTMTTDELRELLRYYVGNPIPYMQDARYRDLLSTFQSTDDPQTGNDVRVSPYTAAVQDGDTDAQAETVAESND